MTIRIHVMWVACNLKYAFFISFFLNGAPRCEASNAEQRDYIQPPSVARSLCGFYRKGRARSSIRERSERISLPERNG